MTAQAPRSLFNGIFKAFCALIIFSTTMVANELKILSTNSLNQELIKLFEAKYNAKIIEIKGNLDFLIDKAKQNEGDVLLTSDIANLTRAKNANIFKPLKSKVIDGIIPKHLQVKDKSFFAFAKRARIIAYDKNAKINSALIKDYADLAKPELEGKVLMRSAFDGYSLTLLASIIAHEGEKKARDWAKALLHNLANKAPKGGDIDQAKQLVAKKGAFVVMNTYYIGRLQNSSKKDEQKIGNALSIIFPNQSNRGTHINISGMALVNGTKNVALAQQFMEFMLSREAQKIISDSTYQFPIRDDVALNDTIKGFGKFKEDRLNINNIIANVNKARDIYTQLGFK